VAPISPVDRSHTDLVQVIVETRSSFMVNKGFMPEGYLISEEQMAKIRDIPCIMVHGRYDCICPIG